MKKNFEPVDRRSQRAASFRAACARYRVGFFACLGTLILSEIDLDLSNQIGERVKFHLNPSAYTASNQASIACKKDEINSSSRIGAQNGN
jgi:hypothetical protein